MSRWDRVSVRTSRSGVWRSYAEPLATPHPGDPSHQEVLGHSQTGVNTATLRKNLSDALVALRDGGVLEFRVEAEVLLRHMLGIDRSEFLALVYGSDLGLTASQSLQLQSLLTRRLSGEPLAYIVGHREFYGLDLHVTDDVLIPRQETELLVDIVLEFYRKARRGRFQTCPYQPMVVDVGTGSGGLALAIATHARTANLVATDISQDALDVARRNAINLGLSDRVEFIHGDMLSPIQGPIDVIVSNPPYIPSDKIEGLAVEVRQEPRIALDGGIDGLDPLRRLFAQTSGKLATGGVLIVELMPEQMDRAETLAVETMGHGIEVTSHKDLMGNKRALVVRRSASGTLAQDDGYWDER